MQSPKKINQGMNNSNSAVTQQPATVVTAPANQLEAQQWLNSQNQEMGTSCNLYEQQRLPIGFRTAAMEKELAKQQKSLAKKNTVVAENATPYDNDLNTIVIGIAKQYIQSRIERRIIDGVEETLLTQMNKVYVRYFDDILKPF